MKYSQDKWPKVADDFNSRNTDIGNHGARQEIVTDNLCNNKNVNVGETIGVHSTMNRTVKIDDVIIPTAFNSFKKLILVTCYVQRFIHNMKPSIIRKEKLYYTGDISLEEKPLAKSKWLLNEQRLISDNQMNQLKI